MSQSNGLSRDLHLPSSHSNALSRFLHVLVCSWNIFFSGIGMKWLNVVIWIIGYQPPAIILPIWEQLGTQVVLHQAVYLNTLQNNRLESFHVVTVRRWMRAAFIGIWVLINGIQAMWKIPLCLETICNSLKVGPFVVCLWHVPWNKTGTA